MSIVECSITEIPYFAICHAVAIFNLEKNKKHSYQYTSASETFIENLKACIVLVSVCIKH